MTTSRTALEELIAAATELADSTESWNAAVIKIIGRQPNTGIGTERIRAALADMGLQEMARDAERYRWLRNAPTIPLTFGAEFDKGVDDYMAEESDAAIAAQKDPK